jgi:hypothetical protein
VEYDVGVKEWDVFISHASEDKEDARPLAVALRRAGVRVWLDEQELILGDRLPRKIDEGLARSKWGIVILNPHFFQKEWPRTELDALLSREMQGQRVLLPVWHNISATDICEYSPSLAARIAIRTDRGLGVVAQSILAAVKCERTVRREDVEPNFLSRWGTLANDESDWILANKE